MLREGVVLFVRDGGDLYLAIATAKRWEDFRVYEDYLEAVAAGPSSPPAVGEGRGEGGTR